MDRCNNRELDLVCWDAELQWVIYGWLGPEHLVDCNGLGAVTETGERAGRFQLGFAIAGMTAWVESSIFSAILDASWLVGSDRFWLGRRGLQRRIYNRRRKIVWRGQPVVQRRGCFLSEEAFSIPVPN